jgi:hypothetical protein
VINDALDMRLLLTCVLARGPGYVPLRFILIDKLRQWPQGASGRKMGNPEGMKGRMMARSRKRVRLEDGLKLDINKLMRNGVVKLGELRRGTISWSRRGTGELIATGEFESGLPPEAPGWFTLKMGMLNQRIELCAMPRHFGGAQLYFLCPVTARRVSVLWLPPGARHFASRQAWGRQVAYASQFEAPQERALSGAQQIRRELGGGDHVSLDAFLPAKPKWMHRRTYERKMNRCKAYERLYFQYLGDFLKKHRDKPHNRSRLALPVCGGTPARLGG